MDYACTVQASCGWVGSGAGNLPVVGGFLFFAVSFFVSFPTVALSLFAGGRAGPERPGSEFLMDWLMDWTAGENPSDEGKWRAAIQK